MKNRFPDQPYAWKFMQAGVDYNDSIALGAIQEYLDDSLVDLNWYVDQVILDKYIDEENILPYAGEYYEHSAGIHYKTDKQGHIILIWVKYHESYVPTLTYLPEEILLLKELKYMCVPCSTSCIQQMPNALKSHDLYTINIDGPRIQYSGRSREEKIHIFELIENDTNQWLQEQLEQIKEQKKDYLKYLTIDGRLKADLIIPHLGYDNFFNFESS